MESTTSYTFPVPRLVGYFTSRGIDTGQIEGTNGFFSQIRVSSERHRLTEIYNL